MAYDRYDRERGWREERPGRPDERMSRDWDRGRGTNDERDREDRGFFGRMGDEVRSWFGDEERERGGDERWRSERHSERSRYDRDERSARPMRWTSSSEDYNRNYEGELERGYRPMAGDYGRSGSDLTDRRGRPHEGRGGPWDRDEYRRTSFIGSRAASNPDDLHYEEWRRRQLADLDKDYDEYRRECEARFESDFGSWRERRQSKRQLLRDVREQMEVVGSDDQHVGRVDRVAGDRIILTKSDPDAGGAHHSLSCSEIERVDQNRVVLAVPAEQARQRWRDETRERALFEREDQGRAGPHVLDRSFSGTYR